MSHNLLGEKRIFQEVRTACANVLWQEAASPERKRNADRTKAGRAKGTWSDLGMGPSAGAMLRSTLVKTVSMCRPLGSQGRDSSRKLC